MFQFGSNKMKKNPLENSKNCKIKAVQLSEIQRRQSTKHGNTVCIFVCLYAKCECVFIHTNDFKKTRTAYARMCICSIIFLSFSSIFIELLSCCAFHTHNPFLSLHRKKGSREEKKCFFLLSINGCFFIFFCYCCYSSVHIVRKKKQNSNR